MKLQAHPAAKRFPLMTDEEFANLRADIQAHGLRDPIVTYEGKVLDGRNRLRACAEIDPPITPTFREWKNGKDGDSPTAYVLSTNLHRRHLTPSQRAMIAAESLQFFEDEAKARQRNAGKSAGRGRPKRLLQKDSKLSNRNQNTSTAQAAASVKVSGSLVATAKKVSSKAPELAEEVTTGALPLSEAAKIAQFEPQERAEIVTLIKDGKAKNTKQAVIQMAEQGHAPSAVSPAVEAKVSPGVRWCKSIGRIYAQLQGFNRSGGIRALTQAWSGDERRNYADELREIINQLQTVLTEIEEV